MDPSRLVSALLYALSALFALRAERSQRLPPPPTFRIADTLPVEVLPGSIALSPLVPCDLHDAPYCATAPPVSEGSFPTWPALAIAYGVHRDHAQMCHSSLFRTTARRVRAAVRNDCTFELRVAGLRVRARVGVVAEDVEHVLTHFGLTISHDGQGSVLYVLLNQSRAVRVDSGDLNFTYSATWTTESLSNETPPQVSRATWIAPLNASLLLFVLLRITRDTVSRRTRAEFDDHVNNTVAALIAALNSVVCAAGVHASIVTFIASVHPPSAMRAFVLLSPLCGITVAHMNASPKVSFSLPIVAATAASIFPLSAVLGTIINAGISSQYVPKYALRLYLSTVPTVVVAAFAEHARKSKHMHKGYLGRCETRSWAAPVALGIFPAYALVPLIHDALTDAHVYVTTRSLQERVCISITLALAWCVSCTCGYLTAAAYRTSTIVSGMSTAVFIVGFTAAAKARLPQSSVDVAGYSTSGAIAAVAIATTACVGAAASATGCALFRRLTSFPHTAKRVSSEKEAVQ